MTAAHHLAQVNVATVRAPLDSPQLAGFVAALEPINALADGSPGFVWRLQTEDGDATAIRPYDDDRVMVNLSVWESLETLRAFVYSTRHLEVMRHRRAWSHHSAAARAILTRTPAAAATATGTRPAPSPPTANATKTPPIMLVVAATMVAV